MVMILAQYTDFSPVKKIMAKPAHLPQRGSLPGDHPGGAGVVILVIVFKKVAHDNPAIRGVNKALMANRYSHVVDPFSSDTEKNQVAGLQLASCHKGAERGQFLGGTRQNHSEVLLVEVDDQSRTVEPLRARSA